jgi:vesicle coat complex subunit
MASSRQIQEVLAASRDPDPEIRRQAVRELCPCEVKRIDDDVWDRVFEMTRDPSVRVRRNALHGMIDGSPNNLEGRVVETMEAMREDPDPKLRRNVRRILARYRRTGRINEAQ